MPREPTWWYRPTGLTARALWPLSKVYGAIAARRLDGAVPYRSHLPVICVGNFTAGGSGKTPFAMMLARMLLARGERPVILTRGYGGSARGPRFVNADLDTANDVGDEPLLLAQIGPVMVARNRRDGARAIESAGLATVIIMDDGLQNPSLVKDLSFAIVDGARGLGNGGVIPAGPLRLTLDRQAGLVQAVVFNGTPEEHLSCGLATAVPVPQLTARIEAEPIGRGPFVAFAGIGQPERFFETLRELGAEVVAAVPFPDHASVTTLDASRLLALAERHRARLVTTEKDFARMKGQPHLAALARASRVLPVRMSLTAEGHDLIDSLLEKIMRCGRYQPGSIDG